MQHQCSEDSQPRRAVLGVLSFVVLVAGPLLAAAALAQGGDIYVYPAKGQSQAQQDRDRYECHSWAVKQTGFDPSRPQAAMPSAPAPCLWIVEPGAARSGHRSWERASCHRT